MTTALFLLRCSEIGLAMQDLELLTCGMVVDLFTEKGNDGCEYPYKATQEDIDRFIGR